MCINLGGSKKPGRRVTDEELEAKQNTEPKTEEERLDALREGPTPTVLGSNKSSLALASRRRQLIDSFKYGLSSTFQRQTNLDKPITKAEGSLKQAVDQRRLTKADETGNFLGARRHRKPRTPGLLPRRKRPTLSTQTQTQTQRRRRDFDINDRRAAL